MQLKCTPVTLNRTRHLLVGHGQQERSFRMEYVSNSPFAESEFSKWKKEVYNIKCMVNALDWDMDVWRELARHFNPQTWSTGEVISYGVCFQ